MTRSRSRARAPRRAALCAALLLAGLRPAAADEWFEHYAAAEEALNAQDWETAVEELNEAIARRQQPGLRVRWEGLTAVDYHPYLKLGIAYYHLGRYDEALAAFDSEVRWGVITKASWKQQRPDMQNLLRFQQLALDAKAEAARSEQERIETVVADSLKEAGLLEKQGRWAEALEVLGNALAVRPEDEDALALMERLRVRMAEEERRLELERRVAGLVDRGKELYDQEGFREAAAAFQQAYSLQPRDDIKALLESAQGGLRAQVQAERTAAQRRAFIDEAMAEARQLEGAEQLAAALDKLQSVLALQPDHARALAQQSRLLARQAERDREELRREQVARLVDAGIAQLQRGEYGEAVVTFNRAIGMDPENATAQSSLSQAYDSLSRRILESGAPIVAMVPPSIALANPIDEVDPDAAPPAEDDGVAALPAETVSSPHFVLTGMIVDDDPEVRIAYYKQTGTDDLYDTDPDDETAGNGDGLADAPEARLAGERWGDRLYRFNFSRAVRLRPGRVTWKVVATDVDGLTAEVVHQVNYVRPWSRSPWPYGAAVALVFVGLASQQGVRRYRRQQLRKRHYNPYIAGAPVMTDDMFFGRERLMSRVLQTIHNNSILLYGERRIGKTSFQHRLKHRLEQLDDPHYRFYPVFIDLQGTPQEQFFYTLAEGIYEGLAPQGVRPEGSRFAEGLPYDYQAFVRDLRPILKQLKQRCDRRVKLVLLIDEVDELNAYDPRINQKLRSLFMKSFAEDLAAVVSGVAIKKHWSSEGSPWYNFFEEVAVEPFRRKDAVELVERPIQGIFKMDKGVLDRIIEITGCKPYSIQKLCVELVNRLHAQNRGRITLGDVETVSAMVEL